MQSFAEPVPYSERLSLALMLARQGFQIFPLRPNSKEPLSKADMDGQGWKEYATTDEGNIREWFAFNPGMNYAVSPGANAVVIDADNDIRTGKDGESEFRRLMAEHMSDESGLKTFAVKTPRGGKHFYYMTTRSASNSVSKLASGIDVRGDGGYVVGPGCHTEATPDGKTVTGEYVVINDGTILDAPEWLMSAIGAGQKRDPLAQVPLVEPDMPSAIERGREFLKAWPPAIQGEGGDHHTYVTAERLKDFGLSESKVIDLLTEELIAAPDGMKSWNDCCDPPWSPGELEIKVRNAFRYGKEPPGSRASLIDMVDPTEWTNATDDDETGPVSAAKLAAGEYLPVEYVVERLLMSGLVNLLHGDGGTGKTTFALQIGVAVASGHTLLDFAAKQMPVFVVVAEDDYGETKKRLLRICSAMGVGLEDLPLTVWARPGQDCTLAVVDDTGAWKKGQFYDALCAELQKVGPCLLILDSLADIAVLDEMSRQPVNTFCKKVLGGFCKRFGCTVLALGHPSKASMADGTYYSGTTAWNNAVRNRLTLETPKEFPDAPSRTLKVPKANYGPKYTVELRLFDGVFSTVREADHMKRAETQREQLFTLMRELIEKESYVVRGNGSGLKAAAVASQYNSRYSDHITKREVQEQLDELEMRGKLKYVASDKNRRDARAGFRLGSAATLN